MDSYDVALAPTDKAALISLRTQQIIAEETGNPEYHRSVGGLYSGRGFDGE